MEDRMGEVEGGQVGLQNRGGVVASRGGGGVLHVRERRGEVEGKGMDVGEKAGDVTWVESRRGDGTGEGSRPRGERGECVGKDVWRWSRLKT
jgi:hypothetical protein